MNLKNIARGAGFFALCLMLGVVYSAWSLDMWVYLSIGGVFEPPAIWSFAKDFCMPGFPYLIPLASLPATMQIARGRDWQKFALVAAAVCFSVWLVLMLVIFQGPRIFGWSW